MFYLYQPDTDPLPLSTYGEEKTFNSASPECITQWECGRRRMELSKLPGIAAALQIDAKELCAKALAEFHTLVYATLFGKDTAPANIQLAPSETVLCTPPFVWFRCRPDRRRR